MKVIFPEVNEIYILGNCLLTNPEYGLNLKGGVTKVL